MTGDLGPRLSDLIERKGFPSVRAAAHRCGLNYTQLSDLIAGRKSPTVETLERIVAALGSSIGELYGEESAGPE